MATEIKQLLALMLLGCVLAVHGDVRAKKKDPCTQGWAAGEVFFEYRGCGPFRPRSMTEDIMRSLAGNVTLEHLNNAMTNYCSTVMPELVRCFEGNVVNCTAQQKLKLRSLVQQTGFVCEPNTNRTNPKLQYIWNQLTSAELSANPGFCPTADMGHISTVCKNESLEALNVSRSQLNSFLRNISLEELPQTVQRLFGIRVSCGARQIKALASSCPQWRRHALWFFLQTTSMPALSFNLNFSTGQLDTMFGWNNPSAQTRQNEDQYQDNLISWF